MSPRCERTFFKNLVWENLKNITNITPFSFLAVSTQGQDSLLKQASYKILFTELKDGIILIRERILKYCSKILMYLMGIRKFPCKLWLPPKRKTNNTKMEELPHTE